MRIGIAQINTIIGDFTGNEQKILSASRQLHEDGAELIVFPELTITGYPPRDLLERGDFMTAVHESLDRLLAALPPVPVVLGIPTRNTNPNGKPLWNSAVVCHKQQVVFTHNKLLLPDYDVFDENRYFQANDSIHLWRYNNKKIAFTICEDLWAIEPWETGKRYLCNPSEMLKDQAPDLVINLSASPFHYDKPALRHDIFQRNADYLKCPVVAVNLVGGNDELIFDGCSTVALPGNRTRYLSLFAEECTVIDLAAPQYTPAPLPETERMLFSALSLGVRDYMYICGFKKAVIGLSGGIDSALTAVIAADAIGPENVIGVAMPARYSSPGSITDAHWLAENLGIQFYELPIDRIFTSFLSVLDPVFTGRDPDVTEENIQARIRGTVLMALANKFGALVLTTGNKSELAVGYATLYGDMCGGLAVISDVLKTMVYRLAHWINREQEIIPEATITKPPSAELRPDQKDSDSLPEYHVLDEILEHFITGQQSLREIKAYGHEPGLIREVVSKIIRSEYKRRQAAPALKVTPKAFGIGRRLPIAQKFSG